ncbi:MAG: ABC transporter permease [bacterium]
MVKSCGQPQYITTLASALFFIIALYPLLVMCLKLPDADVQYLLTLRQYELLKNGFFLAGGVTIFSSFLGLPFALLLSHTDLYLKNIFRYLYLAPLIIPPYISTISWIHILGKNSYGNTYLMSLLSLKSPPFSMYNLWGAIWIMGLSYFPFVTLVCISGFKSIDTHMEEAASLTSGKMGIIKSIILPLSGPYIFASGIFVFIFSFINYHVPALLEINTYPIEIFAQFSSYCNESAAVAFTLPLIIICLGLILAQKYYMGKRSYVSLSTGEKSPWKLGKWQWPALFFVIIILFLSVIVPIADLIIAAGPLKSYVKAFRTSYMQIGYTLLWSCIAATVMMILGFFITYYIERTDGVISHTIDTLSIVLFAIPGTVIGIGLIRGWNSPFTDFIYKGSSIILMAYIARYIPFMIRGVSSSIKKIDTHLEEAGALTRVGWLKRMYTIIMPLAKPGLIAGWLITFILSIGELDATLLVMPPGKTTLAVRIYTLMHYGANKLVAALCLILLICCVFPVIILLLVRMCYRKRRSLCA